MSADDERLRAALAALAEHENLEKLRAGLAADAQAASVRVEGLAQRLRDEQRDVDELSSGVMGFLQALAQSDEMVKEKRELAEAAARLREGIAARDQLHARLADIDRRLGARSAAQLGAEVAAARAAKEIALSAIGASAAAQLQELAIRIEAIDYELVPLTEALTAGGKALAALDELVRIVGLARDLPRTDARRQVDKASGLAGQAQASLAEAYRAIDGLAPPDDASPQYAAAISYEDRAPFVDDWLHRLFEGAGDRDQRWTAALTELAHRRERAHLVFEPVIARHHEVAQRRLAFEHQRQRVIDRGS